MTRLKEMGAWLDVNGEAIYGTRPSSHPAPAWGRFTARPPSAGAGQGGRLYAHVFNWPEDGKITIPKTEPKVSRVYLLADQNKTPLKIKVEGGKVVVSLPDEAADPISTTLVIEFGQ